MSKLEDVERGIVNYDNLIREYEAVQGVAPTEAEKKSDLLDMLPGEIRENLLNLKKALVCSTEDYVVVIICVLTE